MLFWMLVVGIVSQTVFPRILIGVTDCGEWYFDAYLSPRTAPNFIPFRTIWLFWEHRADSSAWASISLLNLAGNVLLFVPVGVLFPLAYPKSDRFKSIFLWSLGGIVCIETLQYFFRQGRRCGRRDLERRGYLAWLRRLSAVPQAHRTDIRPRRQASEWGRALINSPKSAFAACALP